jgi:hypothetical protein
MKPPQPPSTSRSISVTSPYTLRTSGRGYTTPCTKPTDRDLYTFSLPSDRPYSRDELRAQSLANSPASPASPAANVDIKVEGMPYMIRDLMPEVREINGTVPPPYCLYASLDNIYMYIHISGAWPIRPARLTPIAIGHRRLVQLAGHVAAYQVLDLKGFRCGCEMYGSSFTKYGSICREARLSAEWWSLRQR